MPKTSRGVTARLLRNLQRVLAHLQLHDGQNALWARRFGDYRQIGLWDLGQPKARAYGKLITEPKLGPEAMT